MGGAAARIEDCRKGTSKHTRVPQGLRDASLPKNAGDATRRWSYFDAVVLFSMFTTCTRRLASAIGWFGSFSLLLP